MKNKTWFVVLAIVLAVPALLLGRIIWPDAMDVPQPSATQMPLFIFLAIVEAAVFGTGISFLVFGWLLVKRAKGNLAVFISLAWLLISWWPHDNMHRHNGMDVGGLLVIEYVFHLTIIVASVIVARWFWKQVRARNGEAA